MFWFFIYFATSVAVTALMIIASACLRIARIFEKTEEGNCMCFENEDNDTM